MSNDAKIENLLREAMTQDMRNNCTAPGNCPDDEVLAAYLDGGLDETQRRAVEAHLETCDECRLMLGLAFQSQEEHSAAYSQEMMDQASALAKPRQTKAKAVSGGGAGLWDRVWSWLSPPKLALGAAAVIVTVLVVGVFDPDQPDYLAKTDIERPAQQAPADAEGVAPMMAQEAAPVAPLAEDTVSGMAPAPERKAPAGVAQTTAPAVIAKAPASAAVAKSPAPAAARREKAKQERARAVTPPPGSARVFRYQQSMPSAPCLQDEMRLGRAPQNCQPMMAAALPLKVPSLGFYKMRASQVPGYQFEYTSPELMAKDLAQGKYKIALADTTLLDKLPQGYKAVDVARYPLAVVVNAANPVAGLSRQQLRDIYSGKITNWREVGGPNEPIEVLALPANTYAAQLWSSLIGEQGGAAVVARLEVMHYLAQTPAAIGYVPVGQIRGMQNTKALAVDGVSPLGSERGFNKDYRFGGRVAVVYRDGNMAKTDAETLAKRLRGGGR